ncbi:TIGR03086 family metal-binding protein [Goodfellowiella coeruleoviolacea]|uniref:TIGR03086 family metal-binding protein n=1 Tax=Goodfellowiella coeruleoviolacea TaxID=334858 RepID=UPI0020A615C2|nr:TIGR03086 family metal-binding protein [Goodfellowiella coeruleoviolacea]
MPTNSPDAPTPAFATVDFDVVTFDRQAVHASLALVAQVSADDLTRPTPCPEWTLHGLLTHMTAQHHGFASAARGEGDPALWRSRPLGEDHVATYRESAERVLAAFAADGVLDRTFPLPEFGPGAAFPGRLAISFHFIDYVVHSWDVARTLGRTVEFEPDLLTAALAVARAVPDGAARRKPGAAFAPAVAWSGGSRLDEIVALLGRRPTWPDRAPAAG